MTTSQFDEQLVLKPEHNRRAGEELTSFLRDHGVSPARLEQARRFAAEARVAVGHLKLHRDPIIERFLQDSTAYGHAVATTIVVGLMLETFGIEAEQTRRKIGLAALLHDIGLFQLLPRLKTQNPEEMTPEEWKAYLEHPAEGARMLYDVHGIDRIVVQAIAQHHERRDGRGFPGNLGSSRISRIAEMIGIADELLHLLAAFRANPGLSPLAEMNKRAFNQFSPDVVDAFCLAFLRPERRR